MKKLLIPEINIDLQIKINNQIIKTSNSDDCYFWIGHCGFNNTPRITINYKQYFVSRIIYKLHYNIDPSNLSVLHTRMQGGHNARCLNPKHLYLGTQSDNQIDSVADGTNSFLQYSNEIIKQIRLLYATGKYTQQELANIFNMTQGHISNIINYKER